MFGQVLHARHFFRVTAIVAVPIVVALVTVVVLTVPDQTKELYRLSALKLLYFLNNHFADTDTPWDWFRLLALSLAGLLALGAALYVAGVFLLTRLRRHWKPGCAVARATVWFWLPLLAITPLLAAAWGLMRALMPRLRNLTQGEIDRVQNSTEAGVSAPALVDMLLTRPNDFLRAFAGALLLVCIPAVFAVVLDVRRRFATGFVEGQWEKRSLYGFAALSGLTTLCVFVSHVRFPQWTGTLFIFSAFAITALLMLGAASYLAQRTRIPVTFLVALYVALLSYFNLSDNHHLRLLPDDKHAAKGAGLPTLPDSIKAWYACRPDKAKYEAEGNGYPTYIVAAQGGGIYAAYHAASVLATLQTEVPSFRHHLFAVSGVSGGSMGASVYAAAMKALEGPNASNDPGCKSAVDAETVWRDAETAKNPQAEIDILDAVSGVLARDLLSPLAAGLFFPDFFQLFSFRPIPTLDRAQRLELAIEDAWKSELGPKLKGTKLAGKADVDDNLLERPYIRHWSPSGGGPALIIHATEVDRGRRQMFSPFSFGDDSLFFPYELTRKVRLSTAAVLSSRFPWITPSGWYETDDKTGKRRVRLADGAYFDNSGITTAYELYNEILKTDLAKKLDLKIIVLTSPADFGTKTKEEDVSGFNEFNDPVRALLNTGFARALLAIQTTESSINGGKVADMCKTSFSGSLLRAELKELLYPMPLGWHWSDASMLLVRAQTGFAKIDPPCPPRATGKPTAAADLSKVFHADCAAWQVRCQLLGKEGEKPPQPPVFPKTSQR